MNVVPALASLTAVGLLVAGCGSGTAPPATTRAGTTTARSAATIVGTTTIAHMPTGTPVHCKDGQRAVAPPPGQTVVGFADGQSSSGEIRVNHRLDGSVVASCRSG